MRKKFINHIKTSRELAKNTTEETLKLDGQIADHIAAIIFEKCVTPYHYFTQNDKNQESKPIAKQLGYAQKLKIIDPETYIKVYNPNIFKGFDMAKGVDTQATEKYRNLPETQEVDKNG